QWRLGDRVSIDVWKQPWLRSTNVAYIQTPMYPRMEDLKVSDLIDYHSGHWNNPLIDNLFEAGDVRASYPMFHTNYNTVSMHGDWKLVWDLEIVMRVKVFMWRLSRDCLPTKTNVL
ncbi:hypothetical protein glysoja_046907, partial [Glycine soja]